MTEKERFLKIARENIKREGIEALLLLIENSDFFDAPASTKYHDSVKGGLCHHSLRVYDELCAMTDDCLNGIDSETLAIVSLFHDLCKIGFYKVSMRNTKDESGKWVSVPFYTVEDQLPLGHGEKSVILIMDCMKLGTAEMMAIRWHMGGFEPKENAQTIGQAFEQYPLAVLLHVADLKASYLNR